MKALIDGDIPVYTECASAMSRGNPFGDYHANVDHLISQVIAVCDRWAEEAGADSITFVHGHKSGSNYRKAILPNQYKVNRSAKPDGYFEVLNAVIDHYDSFCIEGIEGDDTLGILHTSEKFGHTVVVSTDKDMRTVPGWLYNPMKMSQREWLSVNYSEHFRHWQVLTGDSADGYKGCPKIGSVKANAALGEVVDNYSTDEVYKKELWNKVVAVYLDKYPADDQKSLDAAITQMRMARILHRCDYDPEASKIRLWHPTRPTWISL